MPNSESVSHALMHRDKSETAAVSLSAPMAFSYRVAEAADFQRGGICLDKEALRHFIGVVLSPVRQFGAV